VLTGTDRFFSGGLDLKAVPAYAPAQQRELLDVLNRMIGKLYACPVPLVGGVNGHAIAGGFILALTTDYRVGPQGDALFGLTDPVRDETPGAVEALRRLGLELEMVTGDPSPAAARLADDLGIEARTTGASPDAKRERLRDLQRQGERVAAVGDGVNDAPLLGQAEVSIAMGGGTDLAKTGAHAVLMNDRLSLIPKAVSHARRTRRIVRQNLAWAAAYNASVIPLAVAGELAPWQSALGMSLSSLLVVVNGVRAARLRGTGPTERSAA